MEESIKRLRNILIVSIIVILVLKALLLRTGNQVKAIQNKKAVAGQTVAAPASVSAPVPAVPAPVSGVN